MKKSILMLFILTGACYMQACNPNNRSTDDTVDQAMEQNEDMRDQNEGAMAGGDDDADFAVKAANSGMKEVQAGEVAQQKAQDQRVKDYAAMMVQEHSKSNEELKSLAASKNITLPPAPGEDNLEDIADLNAYSGADFDREYINLMVADHKEAINLFEDAEDSDDAEISAFASKTLPVLRKHLEEAQALEESLD